jgi:hypothetical protein
VTVFNPSFCEGGETRSLSDDEQEVISASEQPNKNVALKILPNLIFFVF